MEMMDKSEASSHNTSPTATSKPPKIKKQLSIYSLDCLDEKSDDDVRCGYGSWSPDCLQKFNNPKVLLLCLGLFNFSQGYMIQGTMNQATSSLERRFGLSSTQVSVINTVYDIYAGILILPLGAVAAHKHKPRMLGLGSLSLTVGAVIMVLPHILVGEYELGTQDQYPMCDPASTNTTDIMCETLKKQNSGLYIGIFVIGQLFNAFGGTMINLLAVPMLDENVKMKDLSLYSGLNQVCNNLGPALAFMLGSRFLNIYVDVGRVDLDEVTLEPSDPAWVGAWWLGFCVSACLLFPAGMLLLLFNYETPVARVNAKERISEAHGGKGLEKSKNPQYGTRLRDIPHGFKLMARNPIVIVTSLVATLRLGVISGMVVFITKYVQFQFSITPANASFTIGAIVLPASVIGLIGSGIIIRRWDLKIQGMIKFNIIVEIISLPTILTYLCSCDETPLAGLNKPYWNTTSTDGILSGCNDGCGCTTQQFQPYCGVDGSVYFSACHAGCKQQIIDTTFSMCTCVMTNTSSLLSATTTTSGGVGLPVQEGGAEIEEGMCSSRCPMFYVFVVGVFLHLTSEFLTIQGGLTSLLRSVPEKDRTIAVACMWTTARFLGMIPFPIILGAVFDEACLVWEEVCGDRGSCWLYDGVFLSRGITAWIMSAAVLTIILNALALKMYNPPPDEAVVIETKVTNGDVATGSEDTKNKHGGGDGVTNLGYVDGNCNSEDRYVTERF